ncbi:hypothetical protein N9241_00335 [bacterium]|nr:hypothetical protein [bacterium]
MKVTSLNIERIEDRFPTIYITLISVLLAVGLEDAISQVRAVESNELFNWIIVIYVAGTTLAAWTGYSFVAITQLRRPRLLDSFNVFGLAIGVFILNSSIGAAHHWFFFAFSLYMLLASYAVVYNVKMLADTMPFDMQFWDWAPCLWGVLLYSPPAALVGGLSYWGMLSGRVEIVLAVVAMTQPPLWAMSFYKMWRIAMDRAEESVSHPA